MLNIQARVKHQFKALARLFIELEAEPLLRTLLGRCE